MSVIEFIKNIDTELFLFLNSKHNAFFDSVMYWVSHKYFWIPIYAFILFLIYKHFNKKVFLITVFAVLSFAASDQISTRAFKKTFLRYRPCHNIEIQSKVHVNGECGGQYGFVSSHAANTFALAMFLTLLFSKKIKYFSVLILSWAAFISYSRIYNGVHYPADIAVGGILGMGIGIAVFKIFRLIEVKIFTAEFRGDENENR